MQEKRKEDELPLYLFHEGKNCFAQYFLGAHPEGRNGSTGAVFRVWAPKAVKVSVVGDFNGWNPETHPCVRLNEGGVWECFVPDFSDGELYKFWILHADGRSACKGDPYAFCWECPPNTASRFVSSLAYDWQDEDWMNRRSRTNLEKKPISIYEMHLGSWKRKQDASLLSYSELSGEIVDYIKKMGYTHIELLPITEHPFDGSWGYQVTGYFAPTARYGSPRELKLLIDRLHQAGIGVLLDWVPAHFPKDAAGLYEFDGSCCYEYADPLLREHPQWGTRVFDFGKPEVRSFLISSAVYWLNEYHFDGLRVDAVASMLYRDFGREGNAWSPNARGGRENKEAASFLRELNTAIRRFCPGAVTIAEESSTWPGVTAETKQGGLGFSYKWNMGWMNDVLRYVKTPFEERGNHQNLLTFSMLYAFNERFVLPFSHDEVVHGKCSLLSKMPGDYGQKFAGLRLLLGYMAAWPGKKLLFMGQEFGQFIEWAYRQELDWLLLLYPMHLKMQTYTAALNRFYRKYRPLWEIDTSWEGFEWISHDDHQNCVLSFVRRALNGEELIAVCNFSPHTCPDYRIGVPADGRYREVFNSDEEAFGGSGIVNKKLMKSEKKPAHGFAQSISFSLPPLSVLFFRKTGRKTAKINENSLPKTNDNKEEKQP